MINHIKTKKLCFLALFSAISIVLNYIEMLFPIYLGVPGAKLGLANIITLTVLLCVGFKEAIGVMLLRIVIIGMAFTNFYMMLYSLSGGLLSVLVMYVMLKSHLFSHVIISIMGGIFHNIGQLFIAFIFFSTSAFIYYLPYLILLGFISGCLIGFLSHLIYLKIGPYIQL